MLSKLLKKTINPLKQRQLNINVLKFQFSALKERFAEILPQNQAKIKDLQRKYGDKQIQTIKVDQVLGGMRGIYALFYDTSIVDPRTGITFRGYTIQEITEYLPKALDGPDGEGDEPLPEGMLWLLLTGEFPSEEEYKNLAKDMKNRAEVPKNVVDFIKGLPKEMHPMTQLSLALLQLQPQSQFASAYKQGLLKSQYWEYMFEDSLNLIAKIPRLAAYIYRNKYKNGNLIEPDNELDWAGNYAHMLGYDSFEARECLRGYLSIHTDHEGGNVSAHTSHLVGSALSDPYLTYSAGVNGLAGPLHGLANQEVLKFLLKMREAVGDKPTDEKIKEYVLNTLAEGKVIPGYGHAVLRHTDPRFLHQKAFADRYIRGDPLVYLVKRCYKVIPGILRGMGKVKNPWPNVDAHSGVLLNHYGLKEYEYYTVVFAVSRAIGCMSNLILARAFGLPIERPGSLNLDWIESRFEDRN